MKSIGIFCGSSAGEHPLYLDTARLVGRTLAQQGLALVYGGGKVGLMGAVADAALEAGGVVIGVMPRGLVEREIAHRGLTELHVVEDMHERKTKMAALADGFIALPGGAGTLEEIFEQWTWAQLGIHEKPCAFPEYQGLLRSASGDGRQHGTGRIYAPALRGDAAVCYLGRRDYRRFSRLYAAGP
ncbi:lysine decarboxylase family protein [Klebsiella variicola]|nr:lysine decarboxylase family protein [Klebsiella variicola]